MRTHALVLLFAMGAALSCPVHASAQGPDLSVNWIAGGGPTVFNECVFTSEGKPG